MSGLIQLTCPQCQQQAKAPASIPIGSKVRCMGCGQVFIYKPLGVPRTITEEQGKSVFTANNTSQNPDPRRLEVTKAPEQVNNRWQTTSPAPTGRTTPIYPTQAPNLPAQPSRNKAVKTCTYCGEEVLAVALKCKHCGEVIDPALRAAEEAKRIALQNKGSINVNTNTAVSASAAASTGYWRRRRLSRLVGIGLLLIFAGMIFGAADAPLIGAAMVSCGFLSLLFGLMLTVIRFLL